MSSNFFGKLVSELLYPLNVALSPQMLRKVYSNRPLPNLNHNQKIIGVVVLKGAKEIADNLAIQYHDIFADRLTSNAFFLHDYHFGGYAKNSARLIDFMRVFYSQTGIITDPIYSGKLFYALVNQLSKQSDQPPKKIIALHSGGLAGVKGFEQRYKLSIFPE